MSDWPRVTAILDAAGLAPTFPFVAPDVLDAARERGTALHRAIEADHYGYAVDIPGPVAPFMDAYRKFVAESGHEPIASEIVVREARWRFCGHVDRVGFLNGRRYLLDWKSGQSVDLLAATWQVSGYVMAWEAEHPTEPIHSAGIVQFREDGSYRCYEVDPRAGAKVFLAALVVYRAKEGQ